MRPGEENILTFGSSMRNRQPTSARWHLALIAAGIGMQIVCLAVAIVIIGLTPSLTRAVLNSQTAIAGTMTWITVIASFLAAIPTLLFVRRKLNGTGILILHGGLPAFIVSAINTLPLTESRGAVSVLLQISLATLAAMGAGFLISLFRKTDTRLSGEG